jgi:hypothetical protein
MTYSPIGNMVTFLLTIILISFVFETPFSCVVQDRIQVQSMPRTAFRQEGEDNADMETMLMSMCGAWIREDGVQQGFPSQEGGPRLIWFESPRWRPKAI